MAFDLLKTKGDLYCSTSEMKAEGSSGSGQKFEFSLTNDDHPDWLRFRYLPMPELLKELQKEIKPDSEDPDTMRRMPSRRRILRRSAKSVIDYEAIVGNLREELKTYLHVLESNSQVIKIFFFAV